MMLNRRFIPTASVLALSLAFAQPNAFAAGQTITIDDRTVDATVYGNGEQPNGAMPASGETALADPDDNTVEIKNGTVTGDVFGGEVGADGADLSVNASGNEVSISGSTVSGDVSGGRAGNPLYYYEITASATNNTTIISGNTKISGKVYGGDAYSSGSNNTTTTLATGNKLTISGGILEDWVTGGHARTSGSSGTAEASNNRVTISGGTIKSVVTGGDADGSSGTSATSTSSKNQVIIEGGVLSGGVRGGEAYSGSGTATATGNSVVMSGGTGIGISGGEAYSDSGTAKATGNEVTMRNGVLGQIEDGRIVGGLAQLLDSGTAAEASNNKVNFVGGTLNGDVYGGLAETSGTGTGTATQNTVTVSGGTLSFAVGGQSDNGDAKSNHVIVNNGTITGNDSGATVYGGMVGQSQSSGNAEGNSVEITGGNIAGTINGGRARQGEAKKNSVTISGGTITNGSGTFTDARVDGGRSDTGSAERNTVSISGGTFTVGEGHVLYITGGYVQTGCETPSECGATGNTVTLEGGDFSGASDISIIGGRAKNGSATGNTVKISGNVTGLANAIVQGGSSEGNGDVFTDNMLYKGSDAAIKEVSNFEIVYFGYSGNANIATLNTTSTGASGSPLVKLNTQIDDTSYDVIFNGTLTGSGGIDKQGSSTLTLAGANTYTGDTKITTGTLKITGTLGSSSGEGESLVYTYAGAITNDGSLTFDQSANQTLTGGITSSGTLTKSGTGALTLSGTNTSSTGGTNVEKGTLSIDSNDRLGSGKHTLSGGTLRLTGTSYEGKDWMIANGTSSRIESTQDNATFKGKINFASGSSATWLTLSGKLLSIIGFIRNDENGNIRIDSGSTVVLNSCASGQCTGGDSSTYSYSYTGQTIVGEGAKLELAAGVTLNNNHLALENGSTFIRNATADHNLSGGTLDVNGNATYQGDLVAKNAALSFNSIWSGEPILTVKDGDADLEGATLTASIKGISAAVRPGYDLTSALLAVDNGKTLTTTGLTGVIDDQGLVKVTVRVDENGNLKVGSIEADPAGTKPLAEGVVSGAIALVGAADHAAQSGVRSATKSVLASGSNTPAVFSTGVGAGSMRYKTGSHVDADGYNLMGGIAAGSQLAAGQLTVGAFAEYGDGNYSTYNTFSGKTTKGKGDTRYRGAGVLAQFAFNDGLYLDGTLRTGKVDNDYRSPGNAYDVTNRYYGAHVGIGRVWQLDEDSLDVFVQYLWTRQKGGKVRLKGSAMELEFEDVDSNRLRLGTRYTRPLTRNTLGYVGAAWEKEFDGQAKSTLNGGKIDAPGMKGDTGSLEFGIVTAPFANVPLTLDIGVQGYFGKHEGVTGGAKLNYRF
jgi:autotransporter-associated beta strand protein